MGKATETAEAVADRELVWGETGPRLPTKVFGAKELAGSAFGPALCYPLHCTEFWKAFRPEYKLGHPGVWKRFMPPVGSHLETRYQADGTAHFLDDAYPAAIMRQMVGNWRCRMNGAGLASGQLARQVIPATERTDERRGGILRLGLKRV